MLEPLLSPAGSEADLTESEHDMGSHHLGGGVPGEGESESECDHHAHTHEEHDETVSTIEPLFPQTEPPDTVADPAEWKKKVNVATWKEHRFSPTRPACVTTRLNLVSLTNFADAPALHPLPCLRHLPHRTAPHAHAHTHSHTHTHTHAHTPSHTHTHTAAHARAGRV
jgi:hypothetical protein